MSDLIGRVALVTGGGQGIGEAISRRLTHEGARVAIVDLDAGNARRVAADIPAARSYQADVVNLAEVTVVVNQVVADFERLDIVVNNAGITRDRSLRNMSAADWDEVIRVNLTGVWNGCKASLPYVSAAGSCGRIINLSSTSSLGNFGQMNYAASKAGVIGLTRTLALELGRVGATANAIAPGFIDTAMTRGMPVDKLKSVVERIPLRRVGRAEDVAAMAAFLASDDASYVTGQVLFVCGGYSVSNSPT
jgi:NAD(P)-dependent dehydrogenase (short-subunit alcohol dehydrogenase family)